MNTQSPPPPSLQDRSEKVDEGDFTQGRWLKSLNLNPKQEHYIIATVKDILKSHRHQYAEELKGEIKKLPSVTKIDDQKKGFSVSWEGTDLILRSDVLSLLERKGGKC